MFLLSHFVNKLSISDILVLQLSSVMFRSSHVLYDIPNAVKLWTQSNPNSWQIMSSEKRLEPIQAAFVFETFLEKTVLNCFLVKPDTRKR